eukprot:scaffold586_cov155-Amphora_coffeaeformis.AAC.1
MFPSSTLILQRIPRRAPADSIVRRLLSSSGGGTRANRTAGLRRFYKEVNIQALDQAPWEESQQQVLAGGVESPISAGVDGSPSASGVKHPTASSKANFAENLIPRFPGVTERAVHPRKIQWYGVTVDGRFLKTPMGATLAVPSPLLAAQIAAEWDAVGAEDQIKPIQMPLMRLSCTALDQTSHHMKNYQQEALRFVPMDTLCFWADPTHDEDRILYQRQEDSWQKVHERVETVIGEPLGTAAGKMEGIWLSARGSSQGLQHPPAVTRYSQSFAESLDAWHLTALNQLASEAKSFWLAWALLTDHDHEGHLFASVKDAVHALRLEEEVQIDQWGFVEGQHDYDRLNASVNRPPHNNAINHQWGVWYGMVPYTIKSVKMKMTCNDRECVSTRAAVITMSGRLTP